MHSLSVVSNAPTMSSREIAELTGKRHFHVIADIDRMMEQLGEGVTSFRDTYVHPQNGQTYNEYKLPREYVECLLTGYSAVLRMKVLTRLRELEQGAQQFGGFQIPQTMHDALRLAADLSEQNQALVLKAKEDAPKVEFVDEFVQKDTLLTATQVAQHLGMSAIKLNRILMGMNVYSQSVDRARCFKQWFIDKGYGRMKQTLQGYTQALFTTEGQYYINSMLADD